MRNAATASPWLSANARSRLTTGREGAVAQIEVATQIDAARLLDAMLDRQPVGIPASLGDRAAALHQLLDRLGFGEHRDVDGQRVPPDIDVGQQRRRRRAVAFGAGQGFERRQHALLARGRQHRNIACCGNAGEQVGAAAHRRTDPAQPLDLALLGEQQVAPGFGGCACGFGIAQRSLRIAPRLRLHLSVARFGAGNLVGALRLRIAALLCPARPPRWHRPPPRSPPAWRPRPSCPIRGEEGLPDIVARLHDCAPALA